MLKFKEGGANEELQIHGAGHGNIDFHLSHSALSRLQLHGGLDIALPVLRVFRAQIRLHEVFHPLIRKRLKQIYRVLSPLIRAKRHFGWRAEFTRKLDRANERFIKRLAGKTLKKEEYKELVKNPLKRQKLSVFPELESDARMALDLVTVLADLERAHFPKWWSWWMEELKKEELV